MLKQLLSILRGIHFELAMIRQAMLDISVDTNDMVRMLKKQEKDGAE